jgi:hypothetical protein
MTQYLFRNVQLLDPVDHPGRRDAVAVRELTVQDDAVLGLGQVLSDHGKGDGVVPPSGVLGVVLASPRDPLLAQASERGAGGAKALDKLERIAAHETPREAQSRRTPG